MGSSFTSFKGYGFWSRDGYLAAWMANLVDEIDRLPVLTEGQKTFRDDLILQASLQITGAVSDCLGHVECSDELKRWIVVIGRRALKKYIEKGEFIEGTWLNDLMQAEGSVDTGPPFLDGPISSKGYIEYGRKWIDLLEGTFVSLPLNPSGKYHGTGEIEIDIVGRGQD